MRAQHFSDRSEKALKYLNLIKPRDGWSLDSYLSPKTGQRVVQLMRRNVPISDRQDGFVDIVYDYVTGCVVGVETTQGITVRNKEKIMARGRVLVEKDGNLCRRPWTIAVTLGDDDTIDARNRAVGPSSGRDNTGSGPSRTLTDEENKKLMFYVTLFFVTMVALKIVLSSIGSFFVLSIPCFLVLHSTCPLDSTFDAKKELKRVLRGVHLSDDDPNKPKTWLEKATAKITASLATELATGLGYEITFMHLYGFATIAIVTVNAANLQCYWIGTVNKWIYVCEKNLKDKVQ